MIGESQKSQTDEPNKGLIALRDAFVVFVLFLVTRLIEVGYPPTAEIVYMPLLSAVLMAVISYMHSMAIKKPEQ